MSHEVLDSGLRARLFSRERVERSERGDTMIEVLLALVVLGLTSVALIIAFSTTLSASAEHRALTSGDIAVNDYSQQVIAGIEANQDLFTCPTPARNATQNTAYYNTELALTSPSPSLPSISSVQYWNGSAWSTSCIANASELITVSVASGTTPAMSFVVDSPTAGSNYVGGSPTGITFVTPTSAISATSGASLPVNPEVEVNFGNSPDATDLSPINLTLGNASGAPTTAGTLSGCSSNDLNGFITYTGCTISLTTSSAQAVDFTLVATLEGTTYTATSAQIAVSGSTSSYLSFTTQPQAGYSGSVMSTEPVIKAYLGGTTTVDTTVMSITLTTSGSQTGIYQLTSCSGVSGYSTTSEANGVVTVTDSAGHGGTFAVSGCDFAGQFYYDVNSGAVGTPYTMTASSLNVTSATSQPFAATGYGAAAQMEYIVEPTGGVGSTVLSLSATMNTFEVAIEDSWGNILSGQGQSPYAGSISVGITNGLALGCTPTNSGGIFTFSGCTSLLGSNLTLTATATGTGSAGVANAVSTSFNITGPVASLVWYGTTPQPVAGASGSVMTNQPVLAYEDAGGHVVTADTTSVSYSASYSSGTESTTSPNGILTTCSNLPPINGIINAGNCTFVGLVGTNYTMTATTTSGTTITSPVSSTFSPTGPGPASQLVFAPSPGVEPVAAAAGSPFTTEPVVVVEDTGGNVVTSASSQVEMNSYLYNSASPTNPTVQSGSLLNCSTLAPVGGAVSLIPVSGYLEVEGSCAFGGVVLTNYQLVASSPGLASAVSTNFSPTTFGPANAIAVSGCSSGVKWENTCVLSATVDDAWGNIVSSFASGITLADTGGAGTVSGLGTFSASAGTANDTVTGTFVGPEDVTASEGAISSSQYAFNVIGDTTTASVSESPTSVVYGHESSSVFTVTVVTGNHELLPTTDNVTVNVGSASCIAAVAPSGTGGSGTCSIANSALPASATAYAVTATYPGDAQLDPSPQATAPTGLTVTKDTATATVSESPTSVPYGNESSSVFTVNVVTGNHEVLPSTDAVTVNVGGTSCVANVAPAGTGGTGTCSISNTALVVGSAYAVTATYPGDTDVSAATTATAPTGLTVTKDTTSVIVTASPTTVTYGNEAVSVFTVNVNPTNGENLPGVENVTVNVGSASCVASVAVSTIGSCSIAATALPASGSAYAVTATYPGDADLSASALATAATGLTVSQDTSSITVSESPTSVVYGAESTSVFTVNVNPTNGENLPGVENVTVNVGSTSCVAAVAVTTVGTCSIANSALPASGSAYTVSATYPGDADISLSATATAPTGLTVTKATPPTITWNTPTAISYGTLLSATQLNATDTLPGTFVYSPASGALLTVGSQTLGVTFNPTDSTDYNTATKNVTLVVNKDTSTATVSESPTTEAYGHEASSVFTVVVVTGNHEVLPSTDAVTVNVGTASCVANVAPSGTGGTGTCSIGATALAASGTAYAVTATYPGDTDVSAATTATAATGFTVTKDTSTATVSESPTTEAYGHEASSVFTVVVVTGNHEVLPSTDAVTVNVGTASCVANVAPSGTGGTGTCSIGATALAASGTAYAVTATYPGDTDVSAATTATAATGFTVTKDTSTATVSESPTSVVYNAESASVFTVDVNPAGGENLPGAESVTVQVGTASCVASIPVTTVGTCSIANSALTANATAYTVTATYTGDADISAATVATAPTGLTVTKAAPPAITWGTPAAITYGKSLTATQLNATDTLPGTFVYSPVSGTVLAVGSQTLTTTFTPTDSTDYSTGFQSTTLVVNKDTSTTTVSESPTTKAYGSEAGTVFTVNVITANGENLPAAEPVTVNVGSASCVATVAVTKTGTCSIGATALAPSGTAYTVTAAYPGDADISASATATAATGFTVTKFTPTSVVTDTTNPTGIGAGNLVLTDTVTGTGSTGPTGTVTWTLKINGTTSPTCTTSTLTQGSGTSTATCTIPTPAVGTYTATAAYGGDTNYGTVTTPSTFGAYIGGTNADVPTGPEYYTINSGTSTGSATNTANTINPGSAITLTSITMTFSGGASSSVAQTATVGKVTSGTYSTTAMTCTIPANTTPVTCAFSGSVAIASGTTINMAAIGNGLHTDFWLVTYTNP
jgi:Tfp pilus assembly protein PilV